MGALAWDSKQRAGRRAKVEIDQKVNVDERTPPMAQVCSIFSQMMRLVPRGLFDAAVDKHEGNKHVKGMDCWTQFIAMMFCHLGGAGSLREISGGLASSEGKLKHLGVEKAPKRSTLSYANAHRPWEVYREVFLGLVKMCEAEAKSQKRRFRFENPLMSLDATVIPLSASMFEWAKYVRTKGAVKVHMILNHDGLYPQYAVLSEGRAADITAAREMKFQAGAMLVFDRGYEDHDWWRELTRGGVNFVSRLKESTRYRVVEERSVTGEAGESGEASQGQIRKDEVIELGSEKDDGGAEGRMRLRRIEVWVEEKQTTLVFVTNHMKLEAATVAAVYKDRWQIELFFKALKQKMKIRTFIGTSENAVQIQIWTALIAMLLIKFLLLKSSWKWSLSNLVALLRQQLFVYRDLWKWLNEPYQPPFQPESPQMELAFGR